MSSIANTLNNMVSGQDQRAVLDALTQKDLFGFTPADNTYNANAALAAVSGLNVTLRSNCIYQLNAVMPLTIANAAHNIQFDLGGGTCSIKAMEVFCRFSLANGTALVVPANSLTTAMSGATTNAWILAEIFGFISILYGGVLQVRAAQGTSGASNSVLRDLAAINLTEVG